MRRRLGFNPVADVFADRFRRDPVLLIVGFLHRPTTPRLVNGPTHRLGDGIRVQNHLGIDVTSRAADRLDQRGLTAQEAFLVGIEDRHHRNFGQVQSFAQQIDAHQRFEMSGPQVPQQLDALKCVELTVQPFALHAVITEVGREIFGQPFCQRRHKHTFADGRPLANLFEQMRHLTTCRRDFDDAGRATRSDE